MNKRKHYLIIVFLILLLLTAAAVKWHEDEKIAAWVQAVFSVIAIVAAIGIAEMQTIRQREIEAQREKKNQVSRLESAHAICEHGAAVLTAIATRQADPSYVDSPSMRRLDIRQIEDSRAALRSIPLHELSSWEPIRSVLEVVHCTGDVLEVLANNPHLINSWTPERALIFDENARVARGACTIILDALEALGVKRELKSEAVVNANLEAQQTPKMLASLEQISISTGEPNIVHVAFSDTTHRDIVSYFGCPQDPTIYLNQASISTSDERYHRWYTALPELARQGLPLPSKDAPG